MNKILAKKLDQIIQQRASKKRCYYCSTTKNVVGHHIIRRSNLLYRWDEKNILPVCVYCHRKIHDGFLKEPNINLEKQDFKEFLTKNELTIDEFLNNKYLEFTGKNIDTATKQQKLIHKPKIKKEKTQYEKDMLEKQRQIRREKYRFLKEIKKNKSNIL